MRLGEAQFESILSLNTDLLRLAKKIINRIVILKDETHFMYEIIIRFALLYIQEQINSLALGTKVHTKVK